MNESGGVARGEQQAIERYTDAGAPRPQLCVLVVGDSVEEGAALGPLFARAGFTVCECGDGLAGLDAFIRELPDLIVARDRSVGLDGFELIRRLREISDVPVVVVGTADSPGVREAALQLGVDRFVTEPHELDVLPALAVDLAGTIRSRFVRRPVTAAHVRRVARSTLQAELEKLLVECHGNLAEMARRMGKDRSTIRYHLRRFGMLTEERVVWTNGRKPETRQDISPPA